MIVFPMAGLSSRFTKAGYNKPKYMLPVGDGSMFSAAVKSFSALFETDEVLFVCRDVANTQEFIETELARMRPRPSKSRIVVLDGPTSGQAETVYKGLQHAQVADDTPLTIFNIDSIRHRFSHPVLFDVMKVDGYLEVFRGAGDHWSFVRPAGGDTTEGAVVEVAEKQRISNLCSTGLYYFRRADMFCSLYEETLSQDPATLQGGERYVAPLYNSAIRKGWDIRYSSVDSADIDFTGTPDEYEAYLRRGDFGESFNRPLKNDSDR